MVWNVFGAQHIWKDRMCWHWAMMKVTKTEKNIVSTLWFLIFFQCNNHTGTVMIKLGGDSPAMSMDNAGKVVWAQHNDIQMLNVRAATNDDVNRNKKNISRFEL